MCGGGVCIFGVLTVNLLTFPRLMRGRKKNGR